MTEWFDLPDDDERAVAAFMSRVAHLPVANLESGIADGSRLWWKAQLMKKWDAEQRARWPLDLMQPIEIAGGLVAAALLAYLSLAR